MNSHRKFIRSHGQECMNLGELLPELHPTLTSRYVFHCRQSPSRETRREDREAGHKYTSAVAQCETLYWCSSEIWFNDINIHASCCLCYWPLFQTISDLLTKHINCCNKIHLKETGLDPGVPSRTHTRGLHALKRDTQGIYQDTSCWVRLQAIMLHSLNESCGVNCACPPSSHTTWLQPWRQH